MFVNIRKISRIGKKTILMSYVEKRRRYSWDVAVNISLN